MPTIEIKEKDNSGKGTESESKGTTIKDYLKDANVSPDGSTLTITPVIKGKVGKQIEFTKGSGGGVEKKYVDDQDAKTLASAKAEVASEKARASGVESNLDTKITNEKKAREDADKNIQKNITDEVTRAKKAEKDINDTYYPIRQLLAGDATHTGTEQVRIPYFYDIKYNANTVAVTARGVSLDKDNKIVWEDTPTAKNTIEIKSATDKEAGLMGSTHVKDLNKKAYLPKELPVELKVPGVDYPWFMVSLNPKGVDADGNFNFDHSGYCFNKDGGTYYTWKDQKIAMAATETTGGFMTAKDKLLSNNVEKILRLDGKHDSEGKINLQIPYKFVPEIMPDKIRIHSYTVSLKEDGKGIEYHDETSTQQFYADVPCATTTEVGLMSPEDKKATFVAKIGDVYYKSIKEAYDSVTVSTPVTIEVLKDSVEDGIVVKGGKDITIDFGYHRVSFSKNLVGDTGRYCCFQLLKDNSLTLKNGTLDVISSDNTTKVIYAIQNYGNLTLDRFIIDARKNQKCSYVISNNCGTCDIKNQSAVLAYEDRCAFDVYFKNLPEYSTGVTATVDNTSIIVGRVEYGASDLLDTDWKNKTKLNLNSYQNIPVKSGGRITLDEMKALVGTSITIPTGYTLEKSTKGDKLILVATGKTVKDYEQYTSKEVDDFLDGKINKLGLVTDPTDPGKGFPYWINYRLTFDMEAEKGIATYYGMNLDDSSQKHVFTADIPVATTEKAGLMGSNDRKALCTARIGDVYFNSIKEAFDSIKDTTPTTITVLKDCVDEGLVIKDRDITIDFGFHSVSFGKELAGDTSKFCLFQVQKGSSLTLKNGTLEVASNNTTSKKGNLYCFQNYGNVTLDRFVIDARSYPKCLYISSNNCGTFNITNRSVLIAAEGQQVFDLWYGDDPIYLDGVTVTVDETSVIQGNIEYGANVYPAGWTDKVKLILKSAQDISVTSGGNITIDEISALVGTSITIPTGYKLAKTTSGDKLFLIRDTEDVKAHETLTAAQIVALMLTKLDASKCTLQTTAPTADITDGGIHIVVLSTEPTTKYKGYFYFINE